jgi:tetratricopeptide (TPR) repeat protein
MKKLGFAALLLAIAAGPALCASYDDLNAGIEFYGRQEWDTAIVRLDKVIAAGDIAPSLMRVAYFDRGQAHAAKGQIEKAIADYTAALAPGDPETLTERAFAYADAGRPDDALADLRSAHAASPKDVSIDYRVGLINWRLGRYEDANVAFDATQRSFRYGWLWLQLTNIKLKRPVDDKPFGTLWGMGWPDPILHYFRDHVEERTVLKEAKDNPRLVCQANFYLAMWHYARGDQERGKPMMQKAADGCPEDYLEKRMAAFELVRKP